MINGLPSPAPAARAGSIAPARSRLAAAASPPLLAVKARKFAAALLLGLAALGAPLSQAHAQNVIRDTEIEEALRKYSAPIFTAAGLNAAEVKIALIGDPEINAFATTDPIPGISQGGPLMAVNSGLINQAQTPNEINGVIAHETGHLAGGHSLRSGEGAGAATASTLIALGLGILAIAAGAPDAGAALIASGPQFGELSYLGFSREQESRADQAGATFLEAAGQSGRGLVAFFERFRYQETLSDARRYPYFRSHPLSSDRIDALQQRVEQSPYYNVSDAPAEQFELRMIQAKLHGFLDSPRDTYFKYPTTDHSLPARYARAVADYRIPETNLALSEVDALIAEQPDNPYFFELKGQILFESGRTEESIAPHRRANELHPNSSLLLVNLARSLLATEKRPQIDEATELLSQAVRIEPTNAFAWEQLAIARDRRGEVALANLSTAEEAFYLGDNGRAFQFAERARRMLAPSTVAYRRAQDIVLTTRAHGRGGDRFPGPDGDGRGKRGGGRRGSPDGSRGPDGDSDGGSPKDGSPDGSGSDGTSKTPDGDDAPSPTR